MNAAPQRLKQPFLFKRQNPFVCFAWQCWPTVIGCVVALLFCAAATNLSANDTIESALENAGANRGQLEQALRQVPQTQREGMEFLIRYMPKRDLTTLDADFLLKNVKLAYQAWESSHWQDQIPKEIFLNDVLPYASITETREDWRSNFYERFKDLVKDAESPGEAAAILNNNVFKQLNLKYSTKRKRPDQSPSESIDQGLASCSGLSVVLIDACRAVGVPARFVGTPLWSNRSGNHSWVEIYDDGWHFTGACEATGSDLDKGWFVNRASQAKRDSDIHAIYATSYKTTPIHFPMVWNQNARYVNAVNVTDRYTQLKETLPKGMERVSFVARKGKSKQRLQLPIVIQDTDGKEIFRGQTKDERFDMNDHLSVPLQTGQSYRVKTGDLPWKEIVAEGNDQLVAFQTSDEPNEKEGTTADEPKINPSKSDEVIDETPLTKQQADDLLASLWEGYSNQQKAERTQENDSREIKLGNLTMPFWYKVFGEKPKDGRSLFISMHGGGGAPAAVNDGQYENQKRLYKPKEGVYLVPRAPTNTWNLWHQNHIDDFFQRVIENMVLLEDVNPDHVYIMGYSAGGDGVFQLAPRMADRLAAAAMMAGHPNETTPEGLRNLPFTLHMGELDSSFNRNKKAADWKKQLADLHQNDPGGYIHEVVIQKGMGHWMQRKDAVAVPWMAKYSRNKTPDLVVWKQDDRTHDRFYWLAVDEEKRKPRAVVRVKHDGQEFEILQSDVDELFIRFNDDMVDLDQNIKVTYKGEVLFDDKVTRQSSVIQKTFDERHDRTNTFSGEIKIAIPAS